MPKVYRKLGQTKNISAEFLILLYLYYESWEQHILFNIYININKNVCIIFLAGKWLLENLTESSDISTARIQYFADRKYGASKHICGWSCTIKIRWPEYSPRKILPRLFPPRNIPTMKSMHGNNVVWLYAKYAVDANLFRFESLILTRAKRATNRNNVATEKREGGRIFCWGVYPRTEHSRMGKVK